MINIANNESSN